jgi:hypothetical protein
MINENNFCFIIFLVIYKQLIMDFHLRSVLI